MGGLIGGFLLVQLVRLVWKEENVVDTGLRISEVDKLAEFWDKNSLTDVEEVYKLEI